MLNAIIADDEKLVRVTLSKKFPWEENGVQIVGEAANGQEAYDLCAELRPDILITDIAMPLMDGIQLAHKINDELPFIKIVFFSGIEDFNTIKTAMDINVQGYILKPIRIQDMLHTIKKVAYNISLETQAREKAQALQKSVMQNRELMQQLFLHEWLAGCYKEERQISEKLRYFQMDSLLDTELCTVLLSLDDFYTNSRYVDEQGRQYLSNSVGILINELLSSTDSGNAFTIGDSRFGVIFNRNAHAAGRLMELCEDIVANLAKVLHISSHIGIGRWVSSPTSLPSSMNEAEIALDSAVHRDMGPILDIVDVYQAGNKSQNLQEANRLIHQETETLITAVRRGDTEACQTAVKANFSIMHNLLADNLDICKSECIDILSEISLCINEFNKSIDEICGSKIAIFSAILQCDSLTALQLYIQSMVDKISGYFFIRHNQQDSDVIDEITTLINRDFAEDISISSIADQVYLTPNYISMIFKKAKGYTIVDYITRLRIEKAKHLLSTTNLKIQEIAEQVGYSNPYYFSSVFKKKTGLQPKNYRETTEE